MPVCDNCHQEVDKTCPDGFCKNCHVSVTWEDCITRTFEAKNLLNMGMSIDLVKKSFPKAKI